MRRETLRAPALGAVIGCIALLAVSCGGPAAPAPPENGAPAYTYTDVNPLAGTSQGPAGMQAVAAAGGATLYFNETTTQFSLDDGRTTWLSFPDEETVDEDETAYGEYKRAMQSLLTVRTTDPEGKTISEYASFRDSVRDGDFAVQYISDETGKPAGVRVAFTFPEPELRVSLEITLDAEGLRLRVPAADIAFLGENTVLLDVTVCPYFGSATKRDTGYILVPDGCGGLIELNNNRTTYGLFETQVYGADAAFPKESAPARSEPTRLPVFGMKRGDAAFLGIVESGDAFANIVAGVSGIVSDQNFVYSRFQLKELGTYQLKNIEGEYSDFPVVDKLDKQYPDLTVAYRFLHGDAAGYMGMANAYAQWLGLEEKPDGGYGDARVLVDFYGAVKRDKTVAGVPVTVTEPLTTFAQAGDILNEMRQDGLDGLMVRYQYATGNLVNNRPQGDLSLLRNLGGRKGYQRLAGQLGGGRLFLTVDNTHTDGSFLQLGGRHVKSIMGLPAYQYDYDLISGDALSGYSYLLTPQAAAEKYMDLFTRAAKKGVTSLSLADLGNLVYSDYNEPAYTRAQTKDVWEQTLKKARENDLTLMVEGGNAYAAAYASAVVDAPVRSNQYSILNADVPFYQLVMNRQLLCVGEPINLTSNPRHQLLKCLETGSLPHYAFIAQDTALLHNTELEGLFGMDYAKWREEFTATVAAYTEAAGQLGGPSIVGHRIVEDDVVEVTGRSGVRLLINYREEPVTVGGTLVEAQDYAIIR